MNTNSLLEEFKRVVSVQPWSSSPEYDARREGIAAIVRKLRDELYLEMGPGASWTPGEVERFFNNILGAAGDGVED